MGCCRTCSVGGEPGDPMRVTLRKKGGGFGDDEREGSIRGGRTGAAVVAAATVSRRTFAGTRTLSLIISDAKRSLSFSPRKRNIEKGRRIGSAEDHHSWLLADVQDNEDLHSSIHIGFEENGELAVVIRWRRLDYLETCIFPAAGAFIRLSYHEIRSATRDFHAGRLLGTGALGRVYKGKFAAGSRRRMASVVAVKMLQGEKKECAEAFCRELVAGNLGHPNVVPLLGFCIDSQRLFLVYKFASCGSLDGLLHPDEANSGEEEEDEGERGSEGKRRLLLHLEVRWKVAVGIGRALKHLHQGTENCIIHRDIKPSNILLSSKMIPMLSDFGLAMWTHGPSLPIFCKYVEGTFGYLAPEYFQHGKLSDKTDVFAFGVLLLEMITGRRPIDPIRPPGEANLLVWAKPLLRGGKDALEELLDPRLKTRSSSFRRDKLSRMVSTAAACLITDEAKRPSIGAAMDMLLRGEELFGGGQSAAVLSGYMSEAATDTRRRHLKLAMHGVFDAGEEA